MRSFKAYAATTKGIFLGLLLGSLLLLPAGCGSDSKDPAPSLDGDSDVTPDGDTEREQEAEVIKTATLFKVGYAEVDFTPPTGTVMGAYGTPGGGRKTEGVHDNLRGQLMLFTNDAGKPSSSSRWTLRATSSNTAIGTIPRPPDGEAPAVREIRQNIAAALKGTVDLAPEHIVMASSHSHASPDMIGFFQKSKTGPDKALARDYRDKLVQAAKTAAAGLVEADVYFGKTEIVGLSGDSGNCYNGKLDNSVNIIQAKKKGRRSHLHRRQLRFAPHHPRRRQPPGFGRLRLGLPRRAGKGHRRQGRLSARAAGGDSLGGRCKCRATAGIAPTTSVKSLPMPSRKRCRS